MIPYTCVRLKLEKFIFEQIKSKYKTEKKKKKKKAIYCFFFKP